MAKRKAARKGWQESWQSLRVHGISLPEGEDSSPVYCDRPQVGQSDFRGLTVRDRVLEEIDLEGLCLIKTLFAGCRFHGVSLRECDLTLCCLHGCQFVDCDFGEARLIRADLRECGFFACRFVGSDLTGADLRGVTFEHPDFTDAALMGACFDYALKDVLPLSEVQRDRMADWRGPEDEGPDEE